jgi:hypothetical protein
MMEWSREQMEGFGFVFSRFECGHALLLKLAYK